MNLHLFLLHLAFDFGKLKVLIFQEESQVYHFPLRESGVICEIEEYFLKRFQTNQRHIGEFHSNIKLNYQFAIYFVLCIMWLVFITALECFSASQYFFLLFFPLVNKIKMHYIVVIHSFHPIFFVMYFSPFINKIKMHFLYSFQHHFAQHYS